MIHRREGRKIASTERPGPSQERGMRTNNRCVHRSIQ